MYIFLFLYYIRTFVQLQVYILNNCNIRFFGEFDIKNMLAELGQNESVL